MPAMWALLEMTPLFSIIVCSQVVLTWRRSEITGQVSTKATLRKRSRALAANS